MSSKRKPNFCYRLFSTGVIAGAVICLLSYLLSVNVTTGNAGQVVRSPNSKIRDSLSMDSMGNSGQSYRIQIFSRDPLIIYIESFLSEEEIAHLLRLSEGKFQASKVYGGHDQSRIDPNLRISESALIDDNDHIISQIKERAAKFQGWRGIHTRIEPLAVQRYQVNGFYGYHFDWDPNLTEGNRVTTFMVYLVGDCTGGGTNFPMLPQPVDKKWCNVIECDEDENDHYPGVTFKPIAGSAVFWENFHLNGSAHRGVYHAGLPIHSGVKIGFNIWSWDSSWKRPENEA